MNELRRGLRIVVVALICVLALPGVAGAAAPGDPVDPSTLTPEPPPGALCYSVSTSSVICNTTRDFGLTKEAVFNVRCGPVYETSIDHRDGIRWYVKGKLARRFVHGRINGTWSLTPDATGKKVKISANWSSWAIWKTHGDDDTALETFYGLQFRASASGLGDAIFWFGKVDPDGTSHGIKNGFKVLETPGASAGVTDEDLTTTALAALGRALC